MPAHEVTKPARPGGMEFQSSDSSPVEFPPPQGDKDAMLG